MNIHKRIFSERLTELMSSRGVTQAMLAEGIGAGQPTVSRYLSGQLPKAEELWKLARFFDVPMEILVGAEAVRKEGEEEERRATREAERLTMRQPTILSKEVKTLRATAARLRKMAGELIATAEDLEKQAEQIVGPGTRVRTAAPKKAKAPKR